MLPVLRSFVALCPVEWNQRELPYVSEQSIRHKHNEGSLNTGAAGLPGTCPQVASSSPLNSQHSAFKTEPPFVQVTRGSLLVPVLQEAYRRMRENENTLIKEQGRLDQGGKLAEWLWEQALG